MNKEYHREYYKKNSERITKYRREYYKKNREKQIQIVNDYRDRNIDEIRRKAREKHHKNREENICKMRERIGKEVIKALIEYGGKCRMCGDSRLWVLTFAHLNHDGALDRRRGGKSAGALATRLKKSGYPKNIGIGVECFNCNLGASSLTSWRKKEMDEYYYGMVLV